MPPTPETQSPAKVKRAIGKPDLSGLGRFYFFGGGIVFLDLAALAVRSPPGFLKTPAVFRSWPREVYKTFILPPASGPGPLSGGSLQLNWITWYTHTAWSTLPPSTNRWNTECIYATFFPSP